MEREGTGTGEGDARRPVGAPGAAGAAPGVAVIGTLDTKGEEIAYLAAEVAAGGARPVVFDCGAFAPQGCVADTPQQAVAAAAGLTLAAVAALPRAEAVAAMGRGLRVLLAQAHARGEIRGAVGAGGSGGTAIAAAGMAALPVGVGKLIVTTGAAGPGGAWLRGRDVALLHAVVDIAGLNRISRAVLRNAGRAAAAMALAGPPPAVPGARGLLAATMFGLTTPGVTAARRYLEGRGFEVLVFHATGTGGRSMEALVDQGLIDGVLDLTTTEWADEVVGGLLGAGPDRLRAPGRAGIPHVVAPGALDMVNFGPPDSVPERFRGRRSHRHGPSVTLLRTTPDENRRIAAAMAARLNEAAGPLAVLLPLRGFSGLDREGQPFWDPAADAAFGETLRAELHPRVAVREIDAHINDEAFALEAARELERLVGQGRPPAAPAPPAP